MHLLGSLGEQYLAFVSSSTDAYCSQFYFVQDITCCLFFNVTMASSKEGSSAGSSKENDGLSSSSDDEDVQVRNFPVASQLVALALML